MSANDLAQNMVLPAPCSLRPCRLSQYRSRTRGVRSRGVRLRRGGRPKSLHLRSPSEERLRTDSKQVSVMRTKSIRGKRARMYGVKDRLEWIVTKKRFLQHLRYFPRWIGPAIKRFNLDGHVKSIDSRR